MLREPKLTSRWWGGARFPRPNCEQLYGIAKHLMLQVIKKTVFCWMEILWWDFGLIRQRLINAHWSSSFEYLLALVWHLGPLYPWADPTGEILLFTNQKGQKYSRIMLNCAPNRYLEQCPLPSIPFSTNPLKSPGRHTRQLIRIYLGGCIAICSHWITYKSRLCRHWGSFCDIWFHTV